MKISLIQPGRNNLKFDGRIIIDLLTNAGTSGKDKFAVSWTCKFEIRRWKI